MSDNFKEKYLQKLDQFESSKKEWADLEEFLRQTSSRLALAAEGNSKLLDEKLYALRKAIRKGESQTQLSNIMDSIATELIRLDKKPKGHTGFLTSLIDSLSLSTDMHKKSKALQKLLKAKNPPETEELAKEFSNFFAHCMNISYKNGTSANEQTGSAGNEGGFFSRLFSSKDQKQDYLAEDNSSDSSESSAADSTEEDSTYKNSTDENITDKNSNESKATTKQADSALSYENRKAIEKSVTESLHNILDAFVESLDYLEEQKILLREKLFAIKPTKEVHVLLGDLASMIRDNEYLKHDETSALKNDSTSETHIILIRLLEAIPMQEEIQKHANQLKVNFSKGISQKNIPQALDSIAKLIILMQKETTQDNKKFQQFLLHMTSRLQEFDHFLAFDLEEHRDTLEKGLAFGNAVKEQIKGIGDTVNDGSDLKHLETNIQSHLDKILMHVEEHRKNESVRVKRIQKQNQSLKSKINNLENESNALRKTILSSQEKAYTDPLTNLPNRLSYNQHLEELFSRWERYHENLLLIIWDIDFFKKVNDNFGHQAGDEVLIAVAHLLREQLRKPDFIARFGGEEFVSLLPNTSLGAGFQVAEKMRSAIEDLDFKYKDEAIPLTISCGISLFGKGDTSKDVFERADKALYQAKKQGRNRCVIAQD